METTSKPQARATLISDLVAGLTTGVADIPDAMASAILAGANPVQGLYAIMIGTPLGALLGGSAFMTVCATSAVAITAGEALTGYSGDEHARAISTLAVLAGVLMVAAGLLKLGRLLRFVSNSVVIGFLTGVSITIVLSQLGDFTGYSSAYTNKVMKAIDLLLHLNQIDLQTTLIGLFTGAVILLVARTRLSNFAMLIGMFAGFAAALLLNWTEVQTVSDVATIPTNLPMPQLPELSLAPALLLPALAISVIALVQGSGVSKAYANPDGNYPEPSQDFVGQGAANIGAGLLQGMPIGGSVSTTALNVSAGAKSRWANVFSGLVVTLAVLLFSRAVSLVAMPAMAALLIVAGVQSIKTEEIADVWRIDARSRLVWLVTLIMTLFVPLQWAVLIGVALSAIVYVLSSAQEVRLMQLVLLPNGVVHEQEAPKELLNDSVTVLQLYGSLFYAAADRIESLLPSPRQAHRPVVILRLRQQDSLSSTFLQVLERYTPQVQATGGKVMLAGVGPKMAKQLEATNTPTRWWARRMSLWRPTIWGKQHTPQSPPPKPGSPRQLMRRLVAQETTIHEGANAGGWRAWHASKTRTILY
jgi:SulP family sulfate permease